MQIGDGTHISKNIDSRLSVLTDAWMAENLPSDATDAERVNLAKKCMYELIYTPESIAIVGNPDKWDGNSECVRLATYFDTCCKSADVISATRNCKYDQDYGVGWYRNHVNNFVWIDGTGYILNMTESGNVTSRLSVMNYDWNEWHVVLSGTSFTCRYY